MSLVWKLDRPQYGPDGLVTLYRGDDWNLTGKIVDFINGYEQPVDTSQYSATGYFPSATGGPDLPCAAATGACGSLAVQMPAASTPLVQVSSGGEGAYVVVSDGQGKLTTVPMIDQSIAILDRGFST